MDSVNLRVFSALIYFWNNLRQRKLPFWFITLFLNTLHVFWSMVRCAVGVIEEFKVEMGVHQGSTSSPFLFAVVMDRLSVEVRQGCLHGPWHLQMIFCSALTKQKYISQYIRQQYIDNIFHKWKQWFFNLIKYCNYLLFI